MSRRFDLARESQDFANHLSDLLNGTVCNGIRLRSVVRANRGRASVGYRIDDRRADAQGGIPVTLGAAPRCYLDLSYQLVADAKSEFLTVSSSCVSVCRDAALDECRRFRPSLEDVVEFLIVERLVDARDNWAVRLNDSRQAFHRQQLRAAIRRHPDTAADVLRQLGYGVVAA